MKILQITPIFLEEFGGVSTVVRHISKELAKEHDVTVYTTTAPNLKIDNGHRVSDIYLDNYRVIAFPRNFNRFLCNLYVSTELGKAIKENLKVYDIVHIHSWRQYPPIVLHYYAKKYKIPYIFQAHGALPRLGKRSRKWVYDIFFGYRLLRDAAKVVALSRKEAQQYRSMGVPDEKIAIIPNGIDLSEYANLPPKGSFKKRFNIPEEKKIILYLGRIHRMKGIDFLIKAYAHLIKKSNLNNSLLVIAGPDDGYLFEAKHLVDQLKVADNVVFTGMLSEKEKISAYVDAAISTYLNPYEPFGLVSLETAACQTPVIVSAETPMFQIVNNGGFGFSVKYGDINELSGLMGKMLDNDKLLGEMGQNGRKFVFENFGWANILTNLEEVYVAVSRNHV
jgi:glycosyltransferase involved in cell wall biosynthesis